MGAPHKAAEAAGIQCELRMRELDLFTTEKGSQGGITEQPTTTQSQTVLQWQVRQQWPQIQAWEGPVGHQEKLPQGEVVAAQGML